jgi:tetratricopeptide (TPR) repeat protein
MDLYRKRGELYMAQANYAYALRDFNKGLGFKRDDVTLLYDRALCYYKQGKTKFSLAEVDLKKIMTLDAKHVNASRLLAQLYFDQEKWQDAVNAIDVAIKTSASGDDYDLRGKCNYKLNNKKAACEDLTKAETMGCKTAAQDKLNAGCR